MMMAQGESSGLLMSVIRALGATESNEQRDREKEKLDQEFQICDKRLEELIELEEKSVKGTMEYFTTISGLATGAQERVRGIKQTLQTCKELLFCNKDHLKTLWLEGLEHQHAVTFFEEIDRLRNMPQLLEKEIERKNFKKAADLLLEASNSMTGDLKNVEALREMSSDLDSLRATFSSSLVKALIEEIYQRSLEDVFEKRVLKYGIGEGRFSRGNSSRRSKQPVRARAHYRRDRGRDKEEDSITRQVHSLNHSDVASSENEKTIATVIDCLARLDKIPFAVRELRSGIQKELLHILEKTSSHIVSLPNPAATVAGVPSPTHEAVADASVQNGPASHQAGKKGGLISAKSRLMIEDLLETLFEIFGSIVSVHKSVIGSLRQHCPLGSGVQIYEISEVWGKVQAVMQLALSDYVEVHSIPFPAQRLKNLLSQDDSKKLVDLNVFFARRKTPSRTATSGTLFLLENSSHAQKMSAYHRDQREAAQRSMSTSSAVDPSGEGVRTLVCGASPQNITALFNPIMAFVAEIEKDLGYVKGTHCTLHIFLTEHVRSVFLGQIQIEMESTIDAACKSLDAWNLTFTEDQRNRTWPRLLQSTVVVSDCLSQLGELMMTLTFYAPHFLALMERILSSYRETCDGGFRGIVQPDSEDKRVISAAWVDDQDIMGFLKSQPSWSQVLSQTLNTSASSASVLDGNVSMDIADDMDERTQDIVARHQREADLLIGNLASGSVIPPHEIISDISQIKSLAHLQESMEWFASFVGEFVLTLQGHTSKSFKTALERHLNYFRMLINGFQNLADTCLLVLHLEVRVHCFFHLLPLVRDLTWSASSSEKQDPDREIMQLSKDLMSIHEGLIAALTRSKIKYVFDGVGHLCGAIMKGSMQHIQRINDNGVKRISRNIVALQQTLTSITLSRELSLDSARQYFELLYHSPDEMLSRILEHGPEFTETEYINVLDVLYRSQRAASGDSNQLRRHKERLSEILGEVGVTV